MAITGIKKRLRSSRRVYSSSWASWIIGIDTEVMYLTRPQGDAS